MKRDDLLMYLLFGTVLVLILNGDRFLVLPREFTGGRVRGPLIQSSSGKVPIFLPPLMGRLSGGMKRDMIIDI